MKAPGLIGALRAHRAGLADVPGAQEPDARERDAGLACEAVHDALEDGIGRAFARDGEGHHLQRLGVQGSSRHRTSRGQQQRDLGGHRDPVVPPFKKNVTTWDSPAKRSLAWRLRDLTVMGRGYPEGGPAAAMAAEAQLRRILHTIPVLAFCTLADGANEFVNQRWQDYTGLSQEKTSGWRWQVAVHPDDLPAVLERWRSFISSGNAGETEGRLRRSDGVYRRFLIRVEPLRDESGNILRWYGTCADIDDLKRAQDAASAADAQLRRIIDAIPVLAWCNLPDGSNELLNQRWQDYTGLSQDQARGWGWQAAFHP